MLFLDSIRNLIERTTPRAVYIGAANGDKPEYYGIFEAAMDGIGITERKMIRTSLTAEDRRLAGDADIILLAGGDFARGWKAIKAAGLNDLIARSYLEGSILIGVSAGAMHLGLGGFASDDEAGEEDDVSQKTSESTASHGAEDGANDLVDCLGLAPFLVGAHDEKNEWESLKHSVSRMGGLSLGLGIPSGGGAAYHADGSLEPLRLPVVEISQRGGQPVERLLFPGAPSQVIESDTVN